jgi:predicted nucleic acid-binding protein
MLKVVSNSSPIIHLNKLGYLHLLETIGILLKAREMGLIDLSVPDILNNLKRTGFYISKKLEEYILENS